ncbi:hypothetical protein, partial [Mycoplasma sp. ATU-Cv-703]|uniref:hypothetical protein n=1 Tax=Mycoplasma sp. ATU-Cv-703 TaxID=2498595 RepID=UPI0013750D34
LPSDLARRKDLTLQDLYLEKYFVYRKFDHEIQIEKFDDKRRTLEGKITSKLGDKQIKFGFKMSLHKKFVIVERLDYIFRRRDLFG